MKNIKSLLVLGLIAALPIFAQNRIAFAGSRNAIAYNYGGGQVSPPALQVGGTGNVAAGTNVTLTVAFGYVVASDGTQFMPFNTNAKVNIGIGTTQDSVTPSSVTCNTPAVYNSCSIVVTTTYAHGINDPIASATFGLQEAINAGPGVVVLDKGWMTGGGTDAIITAASPLSSVYLQDDRGIVSRVWAMQPTALTALATPATMTSANVVYTATPVGTWAATASYFCWTYIDALGGESPCSLTYTQTPTVNYTLTVPAAPAASAGAVGWRMYAGITSVALAYLLPIDSTHCTLTTLETVMPACSMSSGGTWSAAYLSTTSLSPLGLGVTATNNPVPQGHTTFSYEPTGSIPAAFQTNYGPFGTTTIASATASAVTPLGSFNLPTGYLNQVGRTVRITGKISLTAGASSTLGIYLGASWPGGVTAGLPITVCNPISGFVFATHAYTDVNFSCTMTTNAVGATAIGSIQPESSFMAGYATGTLIPVGTDASAAAVGSLGLFAQDEFTVYITPLVAADTTVQLVSLHIETLQ